MPPLLRVILNLMACALIVVAVLSRSIDSRSGASATTGPVHTANGPIAVTLTELSVLAKLKEIVWVDVRSAESYAKGHIPGARRIAPAEDASWRDRLSDRGAPNQIIVFYAQNALVGPAREEIDAFARTAQVPVYLYANGYSEWASALQLVNKNSN